MLPELFDGCIYNNRTPAEQFVHFIKPFNLIADVPLDAIDNIGLEAPVFQQMEYFIDSLGNATFELSFFFLIQFR